MNQLKQLNTPTKVCKICFNEFIASSLGDFINENYICPKCKRKLKLRFIKFKVNGYDALGIYEYDEELKKLIFQFKGCDDYELYPVFLAHIKNVLEILYHNYTLVRIPSFEEDDKKRGYNHVEKIFSVLNLEKKDILFKTEHHKQSDQTFNGRKEIKKYIKLKDKTSLENKKILIVDDICTTGSALRVASELIKTLKPKEIKILVVAKRIFSKEELEHLGKNIEVI